MRKKTSLSILCLCATLLSTHTFAIADEYDLAYLGDGSCLTFTRALQISAQRDPSVSSAFAQRLEADAEVTDAQSLYRPQISSFARTGAGDVGLVDSSIQNQVGIRASQRLMDFGNARFTRQAAQSNRDASDQDIQQARLVAARDTGFAYLAAIEAEEQLAATQQRYGFFQQQLASLEKLLPTGGATRAETAEVAARLADAQATGLELEFQQEQASTRLFLDTGVRNALCTSDSYSQYLSQHSAAISDQEAAVEIAVANNPVLKALMKRAEGLQATLKREKRARLPIINLVSLNSFASTGGNDFEFQDRVGLDVSVPLFTGNRLKARKQRAQARLEQGFSEVEEARRRLEEDVSITFRRTKSLEAQLRSRRVVEEQNLAQLAASTKEYEAGARTLPELIDTRLDYEEAVLVRIRLKYDLLRQRVQLLTLTGRLPVTGDAAAPS